MMQITLSSGEIVLFDDSDSTKVLPYKWHLSHNGYAIRRQRTAAGKRVIYMHKEIFGDVGDLDVDHADANKLNNTKENLRTATRTLNNANSKPRTGCSSIFKGVAWVKSYGKWWAYINRDGKRNHLGYFDSEKDAAIAYNHAAPEVFGQFARLNVVS